VLAPQGGWDETKIRDTIASDKRRIVKLKQPLPVHISYLTAWVNKDNSVHFRGDIYQRDTQLAGTLLGARSDRFTKR
jgi:murein L,D-transpeptidase YcbB/YkuD